MIQGEDGAGAVIASGGGGFEFGVDPNEDPELALALRVSMEENRARQAREEAAAGSATTEAAAAAESGNVSTGNLERRIFPKCLLLIVEFPICSQKSHFNLRALFYLLVPAPEDEAMLARALEMSMEPGKPKSSATSGVSVEPNLAAMTEEEQIEYAMRMSMQVHNNSVLTNIIRDSYITPTVEHQGYYQVFIPNTQESDTIEDAGKDEIMDVDEPSMKEESSKPIPADDGGEEDYSEVMNDPEFLQVNEEIFRFRRK